MYFWSLLESCVQQSLQANEQTVRQTGSAVVSGTAWAEALSSSVSAPWEVLLVTMSYGRDIMGLSQPYPEHKM